MTLNNVFLCFILLILFIGFKKHYNTGLCLSVFFLVFLPDSIRLDVGELLPALTIHRLIVIMIFSFWIKNDAIDRNIRDAPLFRIQFFIVIAYIVSTFFAGMFVVSLKRWLYYFIESFLVFWIMQSSMQDLKLVNRICSAIGCGLLGVSIIACIQKYTGFSVFTLLPREFHAYAFESLAQGASSSSRDIVSTYPHRILLGVGCAAGMLKYYIDYCFGANRREQHLSLLACCICCGALYFSMSRGPWISCLITVALLCILIPRIFLKKSIILALLISVLLFVRPGVWATIADLGHETIAADTIKGSSARWRMAVINMAIQHIFHADPIHFVFGFGGGSHVYNEFGDVELSTGRNVQMISWDCELAVNLYEQGILGFILIVGMYFSFLRNIGLCIHKSSPSVNGNLIIAMGLVLVMLISKMSVKMFASQLVYMEAIALAMGSRLLQPTTKEIDGH